MNEGHSVQGTILHGPALRLAQLGWWGVTLLIIALHLIGMPALLAQLSTVCTTEVSICEELGQPTAAQAAELAASGVSLRDFSALVVGSEMLILAVWIGIGIAIFLFRSHDWMAMLVSLMLIVFSSATFISGSLSAAAVAYPVLEIPVAALSVFGDVLITAFFLLFPNGRLVPRGLWWLIPARAVTATLDYVPAYSASPLGQNISIALLLSAIILMVGVQVYRYRNLSPPRERYQTRWVIFGVIVGLGAFVITAILAVLTGFWQSVWAILAWTVMNAIATLIPITFAIAILRANLWDIDVVIRRTTVYAILTALLAAVYFSSVVALQYLLAPLTSESTPAIALSTLLIAALFMPLRRQVQNVIDRRFFRKKYDAEKVLERFSATVRDETDLDALTAELAEVIQETVQPEFVAVWLRTDDKPQIAAKS